MTALRFHHTGVLVQNIEKASRHYAENYGYEFKTEIIHDPLQTAIVRFLMLPGDSESYLELVAPDGPGSVLTNGLQRRFGGLHHVCFSTDSLTAALIELTRNKNFVISEPKPAAAFQQSRIAWILDTTHTLVELVERDPRGEIRFAR